VIEEENEEALIEEEGFKVIKKAEEEEGIQEEVVDKYEKQLISLTINELD
jgi:phosphoribosyl-dephospho-CoA transferase